MEKNILLSLLLAITTTVGLHAAQLAPNHRMNLKNATVMAPDSLPPGKFRITTIEQGDSLEARVENRKITFLRINDRVIPEAEYPNYQYRIAQIIQPEPPAHPTPPVPPVLGEVPAPPTPPTALRMLGKSVEIVEFDEMLPSGHNPSDTAKGISRMRIYTPEMTIVHGKDTITILGYDDQMLKDYKQRHLTVEEQYTDRESGTILNEPEFRNLKNHHQQMVREQEELARELQRSARELQRSAKEMQRSAREMQRSARDMKRSAEKTERR